MINPGDAIDRIVDALQHIPELVTAINGAQNILAYHPSFPNASYFRQDLTNLNPGQILVRYLGTQPGSLRENRIWKHDFGIYQLPPNFNGALVPPTSADYYTFFLALIDGVPTNGDGSKMLNYAVVQNCDLMEVPRIQIYSDLDLKRDYFFVQFIFPEIGDN
jgi:hypothetical protein